MAKILRSSVINAPIDEVWAKIRDFNALPDWHPAFADSSIENDEPGDKVGSIRNFNLKDGGNIRKRLIALSDVKHFCTYTILESPLPLKNYVATLRLVPVTDGDRTYAEWKAEFNCCQEEDDLVVTTGLISSHFQLITNLYERNNGSEKR